MAVTRTLAIIKPDAVSKAVTGEIIRRIELEQLQIVAMKMVQLSRREAQGFYYVHKGKPFFDDLIDFVTSGPAVLMVLQGEDAIGRWRALMGETHPEKAGRDTLRRMFGTDIEKNAVHGSDSQASAEFEINCLFKGTEIVQIDPERVKKSGSARG